MPKRRRKRLEAQLDPRQRKAALLIVERDLSDEAIEVGKRMTFEQIGKEVGVSRKCIHDWRTKNKAFIDYVNLLADDYLDAKRARVYNRMMALIESEQPSVKAIDLYMRRFALLTDKSLVETTEPSEGRSNEDIEAQIKELDGLLTDEHGEG